MRVFIEEDGEEKEAIPPVSAEKELKEDKGVVKKPDSVWDRKRIPEDVKEMVAIDAAFIGTRTTAELHGVPIRTVQDISKNSEVGKDLRALKTMDKYGIADLATAKLMQTLNLLEPDNIDKERDKITVIDGLSRVLDRMGDKKEDGQRTVHLHLYAPNQKKEEEYPTIEVA